MVNGHVQFVQVVVLGCTRKLCLIPSVYLQMKFWSCSGIYILLIEILHLVPGFFVNSSKCISQWSLWPQSKQSARLFLQTSKLGPPSPPPHPQASVYPTLVWGGTIACGRGGGWAPIWSRGQTLWCSYVLCAYDPISLKVRLQIAKAVSIKNCAYFQTADI